MRSIGRYLFLIVLALAISIATAWTALALWYRLPAPEVMRGIAGGIFVVIGLATIASLLARRWVAIRALFAITFAAALIWWATIMPLAQADWSPDVSRQVTGKLDGNLLTLTGVRDFTWQSNTDFTERWDTRVYDITKLQTVDLFMSYWAGPKIAHVILSFGFEGGDYLAWSIEVRRRSGEEFSPVADLFKSNPLVIIAADERDVIGVRSNVRGEDVQLYRLRASPTAARALLLEYVNDANALSTEPQFYNSITTNCTTTIVKMMRAVGDVVPLDWRLIVNGYLPDYAYDRGALDSTFSLHQLREAAHIDTRAKAAGLSPEFSNDIRVGVPSPLR